MCWDDAHVVRGQLGQLNVSRRGSQGGDVLRRHTDQAAEVVSSLLDCQVVLELGDVGYGLGLRHLCELWQRICFASGQSFRKPEVNVKGCTPASHQSGEDLSLIQSSGSMKSVGQGLSD